MIWFIKGKKLSTESAETPKDKAQDPLLKAEEAEKIINEYGGVLDISSNMIYGAPESLLPRSKEEIKHAILTYLLYMRTRELLDKNTFDQLKIGYIKLASFLDDAEAKLAVSALAAFNSADPERISSTTTSTAIERFSKSLKESEALSLEFDTAVSKLGIEL